MKNKKLPFKSAKQAFLADLFKHFGGPAKVGRLLGKERAVVNNWRLRGQVAEKEAAKVSEVLKVPAYLLNMECFENPYQDRAKAWVEAVLALKFLSKKAKDSILKYPLIAVVLLLNSCTAEQLAKWNERKPYEDSRCTQIYACDNTGYCSFGC